MGSRKREKLIAKARDMYACGLAKTEIARTLGVATNTVRNWCAYDRQRGTKWKEQRDFLQMGHHEEVRKRLWDRFVRLVLEAGMAPDGQDPAAREGRLMVLTKLIKGCLVNADDVTHILFGMEHFAAHCAARLSDDDLAVVRRAVRGFITRVRKECE